MGYSVYKLTSPSGKIYIGCTSRKPEYRWNHGRGYRIDHQERMGKAVQKYGWDNFTKEIVYSGLDEEDAHQKEIELIARYDSSNPEHGYNRSKGGKSPGYGWSPTKAAREKIGNANRRHKTVLEKKHMSENHADVRGSKNPAFGKIYNKYDVMCIETHKRYHSTNEAMRLTGIDASGISKACRNAQKIAGGYHWKYIEKEAT